MPEEIYPIWQTDTERVEFSLNNGKSLHIQVLTLDNQQFILSADVEKYEVTKDFITDVTLVARHIRFTMLPDRCPPVPGGLPDKKCGLWKNWSTALEQLKLETIQPGFSQNYPDNEVRLLAHTIEKQFLALDAALQREAHFTRDISHEIRTPISIQKNILEKQKYAASLTEEELGTLRNTNYQLQSITHTLLALARGESTQCSLINMSELLENVILAHFELNNTARGKALDLNLDDTGRNYAGSQSTNGRNLNSESPV